MRSLFAMSVAALLLAACGQPKAPEPAAPAPEAASPAVTQGIAEDVAPDTITIPAAVPASQELIEGLTAGGSATLKVDSCPKTNFNEREKLAAVKCGGSYTVFYEAATKRWVAVGPNALSNAQAAAKNPGGPPNERAVSVWGLVFGIDPTYQAVVGGTTVVGHLVHSR